MTCYMLTYVIDLLFDVKLTGNGTINTSSHMEKKTDIHLALINPNIIPTFIMIRRERNQRTKICYNSSTHNAEDISL